MPATGARSRRPPVRFPKWLVPTPTWCRPAPGLMHSRRCKPRQGEVGLDEVPVPRLTSHEGRRALWASHAVIDQTRPASAGARCSAACAPRSAAARPTGIGPREAQPRTSRPHRRRVPTPSRTLPPPPRWSAQPMVRWSKLGAGRASDRPTVKSLHVRTAPQRGPLTTGFAFLRAGTNLPPTASWRHLGKPSRSCAGAVVGTRRRPGCRHGIGRGTRPRTTRLGRPPVLERR
jgi:hypothetical protein